MTTMIRAIYEGGVLRPAQPLALAEGEAVDVIVHPVRPGATAMLPPTPEEQDYARRLHAAASIEELFAVMATASPLPPGYDLEQALNANRIATGERPPFATPEDGSKS